MSHFYHRIRRYTEGPLSGETCRRPIFMQQLCSIWPEGGAASQYSVFIGRSANLSGWSNAICARTQTSKVLTRVALLCITLFCALTCVRSKEKGRYMCLVGSRDLIPAMQFSDYHFVSEKIT